jgi:hypothetical protein
MKVALQAVKRRQESDDPKGMINEGIAALTDVTERFDSAALRAVAAASGLSDANQSGPDLPSAIVELSVNEKVVKGAIAAIKASSQMDSGVLDIVA